MIGASNVVTAFVYIDNDDKDHLKFVIDFVLPLHGNIYGAFTLSSSMRLFFLFSECSGPYVCFSCRVDLLVLLVCTSILSVFYKKEEIPTENLAIV